MWRFLVVFFLALASVFIETLFACLHSTAMTFCVAGIAFALLCRLMDITGNLCTKTLRNFVNLSAFCAKKRAKISVFFFIIAGMLDPTALGIKDQARRRRIGLRKMNERKKTTTTTTITQTKRVSMKKVQTSERK